MYTFSPQTGLKHEGANRDVERLLLLARDLEAFRRGGTLSTCDLEDAPLIDGWKIVSRPAPALIGRITGHPELSNTAALSLTSEVWIDGSAAGWVRTLSRFYRVGTQLEGRPTFDPLPEPPWAHLLGEW